MMPEFVVVLSFLAVCQYFNYAASVPLAFDFPHVKQGEFARSLAQYTIVTPEAVDRDGNFLSHDLGYHRRLRPRSLSGSGTGSGSPADTAFFKISLDGDEHHLTLTKNHKLLAPGFVVERKRTNITESKIKHLGQDSCHYHGHVTSRSNSKVAISNCDGLRGLIDTGKQDYFIEPVLGHDLSKDPKHPHIVYKPSDLPKSEDTGQTDDGNVHEEEEPQSCGVEDDQRERREEAPEERSERDTPRRKQRSVSVERNVEVLVVVDKAMVSYYEAQNQDVGTFVLTIMNMVSGLYHDASLGNAVNVAMVRLMMMEDDEKDLEITHHADSTLKSFCRWQNMINPTDESHPNHHDVAILLTRVNLCAHMNKPCGTLGLAEVSGMCQAHRSCNVNEDSGLALAFTVAHEMGHSFGMKHDGQGNKCKSSGARPHVMSPLLSSETSPLMWSDCSRQYITKFLDLGWGECLIDEPTKHNFDYPTIPPGVMYDVDRQCQLQYGKDAKYCGWMPNMCDTLWCMVGHECHSRLESAAIGTACGKPEEDKWCFAGKCIEMEDPTTAINGDWGEWGDWSECSRTCGAGVSFVERHCDNPAPQYGGKYCVGERRRYRVCNTEPCDENAPTFRAQQCSRFNSQPFQGNLHTWVPIFREDVPCQLHCKPKDRLFSTKLAEAVLDGTPCAYGSRAMCISGVCKEVGCDFKIDSGAKEDLCGVCHGDGSTCKKVQDEYKKLVGRGYEEATVIPPGARNIRVEEVAAANNYLALKGDTGQYYINGHWYIQWSGEYQAAGTTVIYERNGSREKFSAAGPTTEPLHIMLLFQSENPGVAFEYTIPKQNETMPRKLDFYWEHGDWSHCTKTCGGGTQIAPTQCSEKIAGVVDDKYCDISQKPGQKQKSCNVQDCPPTWWTGAWQHCSSTCGENGTVVRSVICIRTVNNDEQIALSDEMCTVLGLENLATRSPVRILSPAQRTQYG
ncbi:LOW QUALITY PROTEIN: A disintegrin and metalloproteinase with thrombospondin motifs 7-like [Ptychodera flava]|uniref:LOW QUALITY PROTEIN: A disintegrin and metalloproteinase with thrombospondin motifs 7-like n=1 Tax=Ptychodera flava TaxID=63121 RepID=UPI00396A942D